VEPVLNAVSCERGGCQNEPDTDCWRRGDSRKQIREERHHHQDGENYLYPRRRAVRKMRLEVAEGHTYLFALLNKKVALTERSEKVEPVIVSPTSMQDGRPRRIYSTDVIGDGVI